MMHEAFPKCPACPLCGDIPEFIHPALAQCFCSNPDCKVLLWEPWVTAYANLTHMGYIKETDFPKQ